jgi:SAM-dependent methyltransferase
MFAALSGGIAMVVPIRRKIIYWDLTMDIWKFYDITHRRHVVCNPASEEKLAQLVELLRLAPGARVVDIACGMGEFLIRMANAHGISGLGIDISPHFISAAKKRRKTCAPDADVTFIQMGGADFKPDKQNSLSLASCIGASWIFGGHAGTLDALAAMVEPGGWVVAGEPYWLQEPSEDYLEAAGVKREDFGTHAENVEEGERRGLALVYTLVSNKDDWDRYEGLQWYAADEFARDKPDDPDLPELAERVAKAKAAYLRWGRDTMGWAIYVFRHCRAG